MPKIPVNSGANKPLPKKGCGKCRVCLGPQSWVDQVYRQVIVYGLGVETVRYLQYMARKTMLDGD